MKDQRFGRNEHNVLQSFRKVARGHAEAFVAAKDHILHLLGNKQNAESGRFREELIRTFFRKALPSSVAVDTGFIYGFEEVPTSKQLDIILWNRALHSPVYDAGQFVIVSPESVLAVVSVKSKMTLGALAHGLDNLLSIAPLDLQFRRGLVLRSSEKPLPAIMKFLIFYEGPASLQNATQKIGNFFVQELSKNRELTNVLVTALSSVNPFNPAWEHRQDLLRIFPRMIITLGKSSANFTQGWGPPEDGLAQRTFDPGLKRLPYMYRQSSQLTTGFEKLMFLLLATIYDVLGTPEISLLSAWANVDPKTGVAMVDIEEALLNEGVPLLDPDQSPGTSEGADDSG